MKIFQPAKSHCRRAGYSLIEVLVAAGILTIGVAAAARLSLIMVTQEEISQRISVTLSHQETAMRLYQLGLSPAEALALLPDEPQAGSLTFSLTGTTTVGGAGIGPIEFADTTMVIDTTPTGAHTADSWNGGGDNAASETRTVVVRAHRYPNRYR